MDENRTHQRVSPKGATVLVVEDNVSNFVLIARMLGYMGIHCEWKTSGYEVVEYADTLPSLDLILMDIRLPYEDGYGALRKIRSSPTLKSTKVIAVTAEASVEQMNKSRGAGFNGFIGKPLDPDRFPDQDSNRISDQHQSDHLIKIEFGFAHDGIQSKDTFQVSEFHFDLHALKVNF